MEEVTGARETSGGDGVTIEHAAWGLSVGTPGKSWSLEEVEDRQTTGVFREEIPG